MTTIFLDHHSTTPPSEAVIDAVTRAMRIAGNASSSHEGGKAAAKIVEDARRCVAETMGGVDPAGVIFFGSATEASNLAIKGAVERWWMVRRCKPRIAFSAIEHSSIIAPAKRLAARGMCDIDVIPVGPSGIVDVRDVANVLRQNTALVAVQTCNNECGNIQPTEQIAALCKRAGVIYLADASQDFAKHDHDYSQCGMVVAAAHKISAPVGVAIGWLAPETFGRLEPQILGGTQQRDLRGGTLPVVMCAAVAAACREMRESKRGPETIHGLSGEPLRLARLRDTLLARLRASIPDLRVNGAMDPSVLGARNGDTSAPRVRLHCNLNITLPLICPVSLGAALAPHVSVSAAAACKSLGGERSHVLEAIGAPNDGADLRFGLGRCNTMEHVEFVSALIARAANELRGVGCEAPSECEGGACPVRR